MFNSNPSDNKLDNFIDDLAPHTIEELITNYQHLKVVLKNLDRQQRVIKTIIQNADPTLRGFTAQEIVDMLEESTGINIVNIVEGTDPFTGKLRTVDGISTEPAYGFTSDSISGIYKPDSNTVSMKSKDSEITLHTDGTFKVNDAVIWHTENDANLAMLDSDNIFAETVTFTKQPFVDGDSEIWHDDNQVNLKSNLNLDNVNNTSDTDKPVSTAQQTALNTKLTKTSNLSDLASAETARTNLGLGNVDNTADSQKPFSSVQEAAVDAKLANIGSADSKLAKADNLSDLANVSTAKTNLGLNNVNNTSDLNKPISTATQSAITNHTQSTSNPHMVTKTQVGLGNVDNTSDINKPISTAQQGAFNGKLGRSDNLASLTNATTARTNLGLGNVANTSDANKPVSTAQQTALDTKLAKDGSNADSVMTIKSLNIVPNGVTTAMEVGGKEEGANDSPIVLFYGGSTTSIGFMQFKSNLVKIGGGGSGTITVNDAYDIRIGNRYIPNGGLGYNDVGQYCFARNLSNTQINPGTLLGGSNLSASDASSVQATKVLSGSWICLGYAYNGDSTNATGAKSTLFVRVS